MSEEIVRCSHIKKYFPVKDRGDGKKHYLHAVDNVSFSVRRGEIFGVVGESGSGKSTIGRCIINLHETTDGDIYYEDTKINHLRGKELKPFRNKIQMVFQNPYASFNPKKSIGQFFTELGKVNGMKKEEALGKASELLEMVNLLPQFEILKRYPKEMSGGQLQRLAIARALMMEPEFLIADEPVSALDVSVQAQILNLFMELRDKLGLTIMFISHDLTVVKNICDTVAVVYLGTIVEMAKAPVLFQKIMHPYSEALISAKPKTHPKEVTNRISLTGDIPNAIDVPDGCRFAGRCRYCREGKCTGETPVLREVEEGHFVACHFPLQ